MSKKHKKTLLRIIISAGLLITALITERLLPAKSPKLLLLALFLPAYLVIGYDVLSKALRNIVHGAIFDENFLMALATIGALIIGFFPNTESQYAEAVFVMLFYQVGELFQSIAVGKSRKSITELMNLNPDTANLEKSGELIEVHPSEVSVGDIVIVKPGEKIPLDGIVISGSSAIDTAALTGESLPKDITEGDTVLSGCTNTNGLLKIKVTKPFCDSAVSKILELVESAAANKSKSEAFISRFARIYTPAVVIAALLIAGLGPLLSSGGYFANFSDWLIRALTFLVVSCPCALVISVPLSFFGGIGAASKKGILVKGSNQLEAFSKLDTVVFDKTGTLTKGTFAISNVHPKNCTEAELLELCAYAEHYSNHPIADAIKKHFNGKLLISRLKDYKEIPGKGVSALLDGKPLFAGSERLLKDLSVTPTPTTDFGSAIHLAFNNEYKGYILISDEIKPESQRTITELKQNGIKRIVMLTGDRESVAADVSKSLGITHYKASLLPGDKVAAVEELMHENSNGKSTAFVGDGINDAPVLMRADVGVAMGAFGSDAAVEAADVVLMDDSPLKLVTAIKISKKTVSIVRQNIVFALAVKAIVLILSAFGFAPMWLAVFADVGVAFIAILNAMRTLK